MSRGLSNSGGGGYRALRDYGATSSSSGGGGGGGGGVNGNGGVPDVNFSGFSPTEFMSLSETIAQNIGYVKSSWQSLEKAVKRIGTSSDNAAARDKIHKIQTSTNVKIQSTSKDLQRLTAVVRHGDKQQKLHVEKLTSDFKNVVEMYSSSQKHIATLRKANVLAHEMDDTNVANSSNSDNAGSTDVQFQQNQQKMLKEHLEFEQGMLVEREQRFQLIEADVLDVNEIMRDLATLISLQGQEVDTIESGIEHVAGDVEAGTSELLKASQSQAKYRKKVLFLLVIAVIVGLIVTGIIVSQLKS